MFGSVRDLVLVNQIEIVQIGIQFGVSNMSQFQWPDDTPSECPPRDAAPLSAKVYRFTKSSPPLAADFRRPIDNVHGSTEVDAACDDYSLSVLTDADDIPKYREYVAGFRKRRVAEATLDDTHGVLLSTPNTGIPVHALSHHDWWVPVNVDPLTFFEATQL
jgi:hypothetical protein